MFKRFLATQAKTVPDTLNLASARPYKNESTLNLINSWAVFKLSGIRPLVNAFPTLVNIAKKTGTAPIMNAIIKQTFFKHFCGGENLKEVSQVMKKLQDINVGSVLDLALEADLDAKSLYGKDAQQQTANMVNQFKECIDIAAIQPDSFIAVKITALTPPAILQSWSSTLFKLELAYHKLADKEGNITLAKFKELAKEFPGLSKLDMEKLFRQNDLNNSGTLSYSDVLAIFSLFEIENCKALVIPGLKNHVSEQDLDTAALLITEIKRLAQYALDKKVLLMMDAEQTYFQRAIDDVVIGLSRKCNPKGNKGPLIFQTYQMYLKSSLQRLKTDIARAEQKGYPLGMKLVRGAYMDQERKLAKENGYESPIHDTIEDTHNAYNQGIQHIIEKQAKLPKGTDSVRSLSLVVASHNQESIERATQLMETHSIPRQGGWIYFGQLKGMRDAITNNLGMKGYRALKYVPYGPVDICIAYLHRRALENGSVVGQMGDDKSTIAKELKLRFFSK
ncbi:hypothetical protein HK103_005463 [Boothiomyces macroporosus]|uniref:Proline dehydrogenase n=1 Tax=Boothiomyces macroporosus TaxID=261099 RepID=A0AAD5UFS7_9FUNG|nr:hypothetical protein HK103_005463 [Boothiomyces macroporosus]